VENEKNRRSLRSTLFGWWYVMIGLGFLLLAINRILIGGVPWLIAIRLVISAGFFLLGYLELSSRLKRPR
jgi:hypothetical protein